MESTTVRNADGRLLMTVYKYASVSQTERKITNFIRQNLDSFTTLAGVEKAVMDELERLKSLDKRTGQISTRTWKYSTFREHNYYALSFDSNRRIGFLIIKETWKLKQY